MARRKRSASEEASSSAGNGLEPAWPSSPKFPPVYTLYVRNQYGVKEVRAFRATYAAKRYIDTVTEGGRIKWLNCCTIEAENGVVIYSTTSKNPRPEDIKFFDMEMLMEHEDNDEEAAWEIPHPYCDQWPMFSRMTTEAAAPRNLTPGAATRPTREPKAPREPKARRVEGNVTVGQLAEQMGIEPTKARAALRKSGEPKPAQGWEWSPADLERIKKIIKDNFK